ncbi:type II secretion system GspH family protein [bacterium]|nr:type II secretion system GspH family protein [bacterium]MBU1958400.1 type II secretion system GspH family protein [bacterium]
MRSKNMLVKRHSAFSLLELIVVVLIVSLIGFLVFSSAIKQQTKTEVLDPSTLPTTFRKTFQGQGDIELFCINKCTECYVAQGKQITAYDGGIQFGKNIEIHQLDKDNHLVHMDELGRIKDEKICLRYHLYPNGSTTQMIISNDQGIYFLPSYFGEAQKVEDMEEAKALWIKDTYDLRDSGSFY